MQRIAPNNALPATHFIEVFKGKRETNQEYVKYWSDTYRLLCNEIRSLDQSLAKSNEYKYKTIAIFRIRENKLPTKHKF
ncbi:MAG TPA: hypothetical protein VJ552_05480 [Sediminibacterium sp.]|nr:hypothetical protein [Sediminibacterium sp.]